MTTSLIRPDANAHYYTSDGKPAYDKNLRDARKAPGTLFPSVTGIINMKAKPQLTAWLQNQAVLAALTLPRIEGESEDAFAKRAVEDSKQHSLKAAEFGTRIHAGCEEYARAYGYGYQVGIPTELAVEGIKDYLGHFRTWLFNITKVIAIEQVVVNRDMGYGGRVDLIAEHKTHGTCIIDIKTQGVKEGGKATAYPEWLWQLVAYEQAFGIGDQDRSIETYNVVRLISLIINSTKPEPVIEHVWLVEDHETAWEAFKACFTLWKIEKKFNPVGGQV